MKIIHKSVEIGIKIVCAIYALMFFSHGLLFSFYENIFLGISFIIISIVFLVSPFIYYDGFRLYIFKDRVVKLNFFKKRNYNFEKYILVECVINKATKAKTYFVLVDKKTYADDKIGLERIKKVKRNAELIIKTNYLIIKRALDEINYKYDNIIVNEAK